MSMTKSLRDEIREYISEGMDSKIWKSTGWVSIKCPVCDHNSKKHHLSIQLKEGTPIIYKCFRASCGIGGIMDKNMARKIGISNSKLLADIDDEMLKFHKFKDNIEYHKSEKRFSTLLTNKKNVEDYFYDRTHVNLVDVQDKLRIFTDLNDFYKKNKRYIDYDKIKYFLNLDRNSDFIYFLNDTHSMILYRELKDNGRKGKIPLVNTDNSFKTHKPYAFKNKGEYKIHKKNSNTIFLAEGTFDIINTYLHLAKDIEGYFVASGGFSQSYRILKNFSKYYFKPVVIISSDNDVAVEYYRYKLLPRIRKRIGKMILLYNKNGKDMGDLRDGKLDVEKITLYDEDI